jgi:perosamine synthetase
MAATRLPIPISRPMLGEEEKQAVLAVMEAGQLAHGALTEQFEQAFATFTGRRHAVAVSSGTAALYLALHALGVGPGDEVITTPFTFVASANSILYCGARPVFVDIEPDTLNIAPDRVEAAITNRTKAILPVHLFGHPADLPALLEIAERHGLVVVEDAAQAHGATISGQRVGSFATGCFSFYATKNMTTGEGGMVTTDDPALAGRLRMLRAHGSRQRYLHETLGYNFRLTELQAAIGLAQLVKLPALTERRRANAARLSQRLAGLVTVPTSRPWAGHVFNQYTVRVPGGRRDLPKRLARLGIGTGVYYPVPVHRQPLYRHLGYTDQLPEAEAACDEVLSLPIHPALTDDEVECVAQAVVAELESLSDTRLVRCQAPL